MKRCVVAVALIVATTSSPPPPPSRPPRPRGRILEHRRATCRVRCRCFLFLSRYVRIAYYSCLCVVCRIKNSHCPPLIGHQCEGLWELRDLLLCREAVPLDAPCGRGGLLLLTSPTSPTIHSLFVVLLAFWTQYNYALCLDRVHGIGRYRIETLNSAHRNETNCM